MSSPSRPQLGTARPGWQLQYLLLALIWGMSFLFIKEGVRAFAPLQITLGRVAAGAAVLIAVLLVRRERLPHGRSTRGHLVVVAVINNVIPFSLFAYAEQRIPSALAGICNASAPLFGALIAAAVLPDERLSARRAAGLATGFLGVFVVLGAWAGLAGHDLSGALMALGGGLCYGIGFPYTRRFLTGTGNSSLSLAAGQLMCSTVILAFMAPVLTSAPTRWQATSVLCITLLGVLGTGIAYLLYYDIIAAVGATIATTVGYVMPLVSILAGIALLGERLTWNEPVGAAVIVTGAVLVQARRLSPRVIRTPAHRHLEHARAHHRRAGPVRPERPYDPFLLRQQGSRQGAKAASVGMLDEPLQEVGSNSLPLAGVLDQDRQLGGVASHSAAARQRDDGGRSGGDQREVLRAPGQGLIEVAHGEGPQRREKP